MTRLRSLALVPLLAVALVGALLAGRALAATAATSATAGAPACGDADIAVTAGNPQGAAGHGSVVLRFQNIGGARCTLRGYPGLDAIGRHGHVLAHAKRTLHGYMGGAAKVRTVLVRRDHDASAVVEWLNAAKNGHACRFSLSVDATPPNTGYTEHLARQVSLCGLQVHPVVAGRSGQG